MQYCRIYLQCDSIFQKCAQCFSVVYSSPCAILFHPRHDFSFTLEVCKVGEKLLLPPYTQVYGRSALSSPFLTLCHLLFVFWSEDDSRWLLVLVGVRGGGWERLAWRRFLSFACAFFPLLYFCVFSLSIHLHKVAVILIQALCFFNGRFSFSVVLLGFYPSILFSSSPLLTFFFSFFFFFSVVTWLCSSFD